MCYIFLKSKLYDNSKKYFSKIFGLGPSPLTPVSFEIAESRPPLFFNFRGGLLSSLLPSKCLKTAISVGFRPFGGFRGKIAVLRHLEGFFEKSEESRPPLKLKNNKCLLSINFL